MARLLPYLLPLAVLCWGDVQGLASPVRKIHRDNIPISCRLERLDQLKGCVKAVLKERRPELATARFGPLRLPSIPGSSDFDWQRYWLSDVHVPGASTVQIRREKVRRVGNNSVLTRLSLYWPRLRVWLKAKASLCQVRPGQFRNRCTTLRGRPRISVRYATATLFTRWSAAVKGDKFVIIPSNTEININLTTMLVSKRGVAGPVYEPFHRAARRSVNRKVRQAWNRTRPVIEKKLYKQLEKLINKNIGPALSKVMRSNVSSIKTIPRTTPRKIVRPPRFSRDRCLRQGSYRNRPGLPQRLAPRAMC